MAIEKNPHAISYASTSLRDNYDLVKFAIVKKPDTLLFASEALKANFDLVKFVVEKNYESIRYASDTIKSNNAMIKELCEIDVRCKCYIDIKLTYNFLSDCYIKNIMNHRYN